MPVCAICGEDTPEAKRMSWLNDLDGPMCFLCFTLWYDYNVTDIEELKKIRLGNRNMEGDGI